MEKGRILMKKGYTRSVPETLTQVKKVGFCWVWGGLLGGRREELGVRSEGGLRNSETGVGRWMLDVGRNYEKAGRGEV